MRKKEIKLLIRSKRLNIYPLSDLEIQQLIDCCSDEGLAMAYSQMLEKCKNNLDSRIWYAPWTMETKKEKIKIGNLGFRGPVLNNSVEIGYGIDKAYEGQGYTSEAAQALINWAFDNEDILFVEAEADENNEASIRILEKLGFIKYGQGEEGPRFVKAKSNMYYTSMGMCLGMCLGVALGSAFDNLTIGMSIGMAMGLCLGSAKDSKEKEKLSELKKKNYGL